MEASDGYIHNRDTGRSVPARSRKTPSARAVGLSSGGAASGTAPSATSRADPHTRNCTCPRHAASGARRARTAFNASLNQPTAPTVPHAPPPSHSTQNTYHNVPGSARNTTSFTSTTKPGCRNAFTVSSGRRMFPPPLLADSTTFRAPKDRSSRTSCCARTTSHPPDSTKVTSISHGCGQTSAVHGSTCLDSCM